MNYRYRLPPPPGKDWTTPLTLQEVADYMPGKIHVQTVRRWVARGLTNGRRKLWAAKTGQRIVTTWEAVCDFMEDV